MIDRSIHLTMVLHGASLGAQLVACFLAAVYGATIERGDPQDLVVLIAGLLCLAGWALSGARIRMEGEQ